MVMVRLKVGLFQKDLAQRFGIAESIVSRLFTSWVNLMYVELEQLCEIPEYKSPEIARQFCKLPLVRVILECTEVFTETPSSLQANRETYSNYKSTTTFKYLVGISPHPAVIYVSRAWGGRASDALKPGEQVVVDEGLL